MFITDTDDGFGVDVCLTEEGARELAWAWLRDLWAEYAVERDLPGDLDAALALASKETSQHGRVEPRDVEA